MRDDILTITIEQHEHTAVVYVAGVLRIASALRLVRVCEGLPSLIRLARIDLRSVHGVEEGALTVLQTRLRHWRGARGRIQLTYPPGADRSSPPVRTSGR